MTRTATNDAAEQRPAHIEALTGLRVVAATWVVLLHSQRLLAPYLDQVPILRAVVSSGWLAVDLFFVLSGFVIGRSYISEVGDRPRLRTIWRFLGNRFARVWPAWAVVTVLMGAWVWTVRRAGMNADVLVSHSEASLVSLARQLSMTQMWGQPDFWNAQFLLPGWSISAEWLAYLCFPLLAVLAHRLRRLPGPVLLALACAAMLPEAVNAFRFGEVDGEQNWLVRITCGFTAGLLAALASRRFKRTAAVESAALAGATLSVLGVVIISLWSWWVRGGNPLFDYSGVAVVLFPVLVVSLTFTDRGIAALLSRPVMVFGGRISYCLYLVHFMVLDVTITVLWRDPADAWQFTPTLALIAPVLVLVPFGLAHLLHRGVEEPGRRLILSLLRLDSPRSVAPVAVAVDAPAAVAARPDAEELRPSPAVPAPRPAGRRVPAPVAVTTRSHEPATAQLPAFAAPPFAGVPGADPRLLPVSASRTGAHDRVERRTVRTVA